MVVFFFISVVPLSVVPFCRGEPLFDEFDFFLRRGDTFLRLLLKGVQHVNGVAEAHRVDGPEGVAFIGRHDLKHRAPAETSEGSNGGVFLAALGCIKSLSHVALYGPWEGLRSLQDVPTHRTGFSALSTIQVYVFMDG